MLKKLNAIQKFLLKINQPTNYVKYKQSLSFASSEQFNNTKLPVISNNIGTLTFKHSGNSGDIIYALPTIKAIVKNSDCILNLHLNQTGFYNNTHPLGNVMLNEKMVKMITPLLEAQSYIKQIAVQENQQIDYDLDIFRQAPFLLDRGDISRWYFHIFNVFYDLSEAWIKVSPNLNYSNSIVLARSERYNNLYIDYSFLTQYKNIVFLGVESEYKIMKIKIPNLEWKPVANFLEMAEIIAGAKFFIGNQSFPYAIAEAMKIKRVLEVCFDCPNVVIHGANGYDFYFQNNFEQIVKKLYEQAQ